MICPRTISGTPLWGRLSEGGGGKVKREGRAVTLPPHILSLCGRGPLLLAIFMGGVLYVCWGREELVRTAWGGAAIAFVVLLCVWALVFGLNALLRRGTARLEKDALTLEERGLWPRGGTFAWSDLVYVAILPPKKGFLELAGRDACVVLGTEQDSTATGGSLSAGDLLGFYRYIVQQSWKYTR